MKLAHRLSQLIKLSFFSLIAVTPLVFSSRTSELFEFPKMQLVYAFTIVLLTAWAGLMVINKRLIFRRTILDLPLVLFLLSLSLSTLLSIDPRTSIWGYYSRFNGGLVSIFTYASLYWAAVSLLTKKEISRLLALSLITASLISIWALLESAGHSLSCLLIRGSFDVSCWVQDVQNRPYATLGQPNWLASYLASLLTVPITFLLINLSTIYSKITNKTIKSSLYKLRTITPPLFFFFVFNLLMAATLITKSRSAILSLAIALPLYLSLTVFTNRNWLHRPHLSRHLWATLAAMLLVLGFIGTPWTPKLLDVISPPDTTPTHLPPTPPAPLPISDSGDIRKVVWRGAITAWASSPKTIILGFGPETFAAAYYLYRPLAHNQLSEWDFLYNKAHNEHLNYLATTGLLGLTTYLLIPLILLFYLYRKYHPAKHPATSTLIIISLLSGLTAIQITNFFGFSTVVTNLYYFLILAFLVSLTLPDPKPASLAPIKLGGKQILTLIIITLLGLNALTTITHQFQADLNYAKAQAYEKAGRLDDALTFIQTSLNLRPNQPNYLDRYSLILAQAAIALADKDASGSASLAQTAISVSDQTILASPSQLNLYKNRAKLFIQLATLNSAYYQDAIEALTAAQLLAPTDPKLPYNIGIILKQLGQNDQALVAFKQAIALKPDYFKPHWEIYRTLMNQGKTAQAEQYLTAIAPRFPAQQQTIQKVLEKY